MNRKEWNDLIINDAFSFYKHWQPNWEIKVTNKNIKIFNNDSFLLELFISNNKMFITFLNKNGEKQQMTIDYRGKLYTGRGSIYECDIYDFCEQIKFYGFNYQKLDKIFPESY